MVCHFIELLRYAVWDFAMNERLAAKIVWKWAIPGLFISRIALAGQVVVDNSFGHAGAVGGPNFSIGPGLGRQVGPNLFQSFSTFNLDKGETATFTASAATHHILARVTGGSVSTIDGTIATRLVTSPTTPHPADFYLINSNGVVFGPDATLDVGGSFSVTSAGILKLAGGGHFDASGSSPGVLTTGAPAAFGFLSSAPAGISVQGTASLATPGGSGFAIVGGTIQITNANINAGQINVVGVASRSDVNIDKSGSLLPSTAQKSGGAVTISQSALTASNGILINGGPLQFLNGSLLHTTTTTAAGGAIQVNASSLTIDRQDSLLLTGLLAESQITDPHSQAGDVAVHCDTLSLANGGIIRSVAENAGWAGNVSVTVAGPVTLSGTAVNTVLKTAQDNSVGGIDSLSLAAATGQAGSVELIAQSLSMTGMAGIRSETYGSGNSGSITLQIADDLNLASATATINATSNATSLPSQAGNMVRTGDAGDVDITAKTLELTNGGQILSTTLGSGNGGNITLHVADSFSVIGTPGLSGVLANSSGTGSTGNAGNIDLTAGSLMILNGSQIEANTEGAGSGGTVRIRSGEVLLDRKHNITVNALFTGISVDANDAATSGNAGHIILKVDSLEVTNGAAVASNSFGTGSGGSVSVSARDVMLSGQLVRSTSTVASQLGAVQQNPNAKANGGSLVVHSDTLEIIKGGEIGTNTNAVGAGGNIKVDVAGLATLDGMGVNPAISAGSTGAGRGGNIEFSAGALKIADQAMISSSTSGTGQGGNVTVEAGRKLYVLSGGTIAATSMQGIGGDIRVSVGDSIEMNNGAISTNAAANGGNVRITAPLKIQLSNSSAITTISSASGDGGNIHIDPLELSLGTGSKISANAGGPQSHGGQVAINADETPGTVKNVNVTATGGAPGLSGNITLGTFQTDIAGSLVLLQTQVATPALLLPHCGVQSDEEQSSFVITGRGGAPAEPGGWLPDLELDLWPGSLDESRK